MWLTLGIVALFIKPVTSVAPKYGVARCIENVPTTP